MKEIALLIDDILLRKGWKRTYLARQLKKTDAWMSQMMNGKINLTVPMLLEIARILQVEPRSLLPSLGSNESSKAANFEEYIRGIVREELGTLRRKKD
jgi:transcriptional regulator with XRE-family HTH domain